LAEVAYANFTPGFEGAYANFDSEPEATKVSFGA